MRLTALIVDDEAAGRRAVREACDNFPDIEVLGECESGVEAIRFIRHERPTIAFLDVQMKPLTGIETASQLTVEETPLIVFVTAYDKYAVRAFEVNAVDYLLKPIDIARFGQTLERVQARLNGHLTPEIRANLQRLVLAVARDLKKDTQTRENDRLIIEIGGRVSILDPTDVEYVEVERNYVVISAGMQRYRVRATLAEMEKRLALPRFIRVHRSVIINVGKTRTIEKAFHGEYHIEMTSGRKFASGRIYRQRVQGLLLRSRGGGEQ